MPCPGSQGRNSGFPSSWWWSPLFFCCLFNLCWFNQKPVMSAVSVGSRVAYSEKVGWWRFSKALASAPGTLKRVFIKAALGRLFRAGRMGSAKLRHRAFALGPGVGGRPLGVPVRVFSRFLLRECLQAAPANGCGWFRRCLFFAGAEERDAANPTGRPAMPGWTGDGSGRGDAWSHPALRRPPRTPACGAFDAQVGACRHSKSDNWPWPDGKWPVMAIQIECVPASPAMRKAGHGAGSLKARTDFQADGQWPSKWNQTEVWPNALRGAEFRVQLSWDSRFLEWTAEPCGMQFTRPKAKRCTWPWGKKSPMVNLKRRGCLLLVGLLWSRQEGNRKGCASWHSYAYWIRRNPPPDSVGSRRQRARLITQPPRFSRLK